MPHQFGMHGILEDQHHAMTRLREEVSARMRQPDEKKALQLWPGVPMLDVWDTGIEVMDDVQCLLGGISALGSAGSPSIWMLFCSA